MLQRNETLIQLTKEEINIIHLFFPQGVVAFDLETTGLSALSDEIVEVAAVKIDEQKNISTFHTLINPQKNIPPATQKIHGLSNQDVENAPTFKEVYKTFKDFIGDLPLIAHNASFDCGFILMASYRIQEQSPKNHIYDTFKWSKKFFPKSQKFGLGSLLHLLKVKSTHHQALDDSYGCLKILGAGLLQKLEDTLNAKPLRAFKAMEDSEKNDLVKQILKQGFLYKFSDFERTKKNEHSETISKLSPFLQEQQIIEVKYMGGSHRDIFRPLIPKSIIPYPHGPTLGALCLIDFEYKSFLIKKIKEIRPIDEKTGELLQKKLDDYNNMKTPS